MIQPFYVTHLQKTSLHQDHFQVSYYPTLGRHFQLRNIYLVIFTVYFMEGLHACLTQRKPHIHTSTWTNTFKHKRCDECRFPASVAKRLLAESSLAILTCPSMSTTLSDMSALATATSTRCYIAAFHFHFSEHFTLPKQKRKPFACIQENLPLQRLLL